MGDDLATDHTKYWRLRRCALLDCLSDPELRRLSRLCTLRVIERGELVYEAGDPGDQVMIVAAGVVGLSRVSDDGREVSVALLGPMEIFGERALGEETRRQERAAVVEDAVVCAFSGLDFQRFLFEHPELALRITRLVGERLRQVESRIQDILFKDVRTRLAHTVAWLSEKFGDDVPAGRRITLRLTQTDLAHLIGSTRETTSTIFNEFRRQGLLDNEGHHVVVRDGEALAAY
ncbi:MAG: Crp/Fnr family transcriptional regulator [Acidobacteriota bacterium]|jgi:CRP-like cAMP-binding protein